MHQQTLCYRPCISHALMVTDMTAYAWQRCFVAHECIVKIARRLLDIRLL